MAFKNEKISEQDREWLAKRVNRETVMAIVKMPWLHQFDTPNWIWTVDHERNACYVEIGGGGSPDDVGRLPFGVLILMDVLVIFNVDKRWASNAANGADYQITVKNIHLPTELESKFEEIKDIVRQALTEDAYCRPFADGGTVANPNLIARGNVRSCVVEFK